ncbi:MAG: plasmid replication initiation protein [Psychroserpens sp.]|jgi:plasmid replication initiation protein
MAILKVHKNNDMITSRSCFSLMENRIFLYGVSLINPDKEDFPLTYKIDVTRFAKMFDLSVNRLYTELKNDVLHRMRKRSMTVRKQGDHGYFNRVFNIIQYADYEDNSGYLKITFDQESKPFLHKLTKNYTSYYVECVSKFKSTYSIRFFEWCVMRLNQNKGKKTILEITIDDLRERLDLKDKYPLYGDLKRYVIKKATDEIEKNKTLCGLSVLLVDNKPSNKLGGKSVQNITLIISPELKKEDQLNLKLDDKKVTMTITKQVNLCIKMKGEMSTYDFDLWRDEQVRNYVISLDIAKGFE